MFHLTFVRNREPMTFNIISLSVCLSLSSFPPPIPLISVMLQCPHFLSLCLQLLCEADDMWTVKKAVEKLGYCVSDARHEYIPTVFAYLNQDQLDLASKFLDRIESSGDIIKIYTNIKDAAEEQDTQKQ